jgi:hypothetical protein
MFSEMRKYRVGFTVAHRQQWESRFDNLDAHLANIKKQEK